MGRFSKLDFIIRYEAGELSDKDTLRLFSYLIKTGLVYHLQGHYGRTAEALMQDKWLDRQGRILKSV